MSPPVRSRAPVPVKQAARRGAVATGQLTAGLRPLPDFLVIGAQRSGTTSLFRALMQHRDIARPVMHKGVNYFDLNYWRGSRWYRAHFPLTDPTGRTTRHRRLTFEASGYYLYHPAAPSRIAQDLPGVRLVVMLRDPVERAYSAWKHESQRGFEDRDFAEALRLEDERIRGEEDRLLHDARYFSFAHRHHSYRHRGEYVRQLARYLEHIPPHRLHVLYSENFFADPAHEFQRLTAFLGLAHDPSVTVGRYNARTGSDMPPDSREYLASHYRDQASALAALVGQRPPWP